MIGPVAPKRPGRVTVAELPGTAKVSIGIERAVSGTGPAAQTCFVVNEAPISVPWVSLAPERDPPLPVPAPSRPCRRLTVPCLPRTGGRWLPAWGWRGVIFLLGIVVGRAAEAGAPALPTLTTVRQIRQLSPDDAARNYPVRLRGVITYFADNLPIRFLQDETGGTYFPELEVDDANPTVLTPGTIVELDGVTVPGRFAPHVGRSGNSRVRWRVVGHGPLPEARRVSIGELADPQFHSEYIELAGTVRQVLHRAMDHLSTGVVWVKVGNNTAIFTAQYYDPRGLAVLPERLIGARVKVRGVYGSTFNERRQLVGFRLFIDPARGLEVEQPGPADPLSDLPVTPISALMQFSGATRETPMVRIAGALAQIVPGRGFYLESEDRGVWVETEEDLTSFRAGDQLAIAGFPALGPWNPMLKDALLRREGPGRLEPPPLITPSEARSGRKDCRRVTLEATLLEVSERGETPTVVLQRDGVTFVAEWANAEAGAKLPHLQPGSLVRVTGMCLNKSVGTGWPAFELRPIDALVAPTEAAFRLLVGTASDLTVVRTPDWWTTERIWTLVGFVAALALAVLAWNVSLRRRVTAQTEIIGHQAAREAVHEDRTRIARELHDTLEQELTGIAVQLDAVNDRLAVSPPTAAAALGTARALLRHTRTEARRSVWDLRAALLEEGDLGAALEATAAQLEGGPEIHVTIEGSARRLAAPVENNLLRIGTEAMTNAVKHAAAQKVDVHLAFGAVEVRLEVRDDGKGFDASRSTTLAAGHFGWLGIRERAERIGARLQIESQPGAGTRVAVWVHLTPGSGPVPPHGPATAQPS
jgi:signal transduction histidine kinase